VYISGFPETVPTETQINKSVLGKDSFLKLLTLQLQYQDIFNPQDNNQWMGQMMQMSVVEQLQNLNQNLVYFSQMEQQFQTIAMLGETVQVANDDGTQTEGVVKSVKFTASGPQLNIDGKDYSLAQVEQIRI